MVTAEFILDQMCRHGRWKKCFGAVALSTSAGCTQVYMTVLKAPGQPLPEQNGNPTAPFWVDIQELCQSDFTGDPLLPGAQIPTDGMAAPCVDYQKGEHPNRKDGTIHPYRR